MFEYSILIEYDAIDKIYVASVPQLRGCMAHGDTPEEALHEISVAKRLWLEVARDKGMEIPEPTMYASAI